MHNKLRILRLLPLMLVLAHALTSCGDDENDYNLGTGGSQANGATDTGNSNKNDASTNPYLARLEMPKVKGGRSIVITHSTQSHGVNYSLEWDLDKLSQRWSCYQMYAGNTGGGVGRYQEGYPYDDDLPHTSYFNVNGEPFDPFRGSGYDHGHIIPSADRQYTVEANRQTFFLTNMQPQLHIFNAGIWEVMEAQVRTWNRNAFRDTLYVCKGGTIDKASQISRTLSNGLIVPKYFFMAVLCKNSQGYKALGFWVEHLNEDHSNDGVSPYVVNIHQLEELTGIDFFCNLPDDTEQQVETLPVENVKAAWGLK